MLSSNVDTIVCMNVLEHIEDDHTTLADFARVLPAGGHLVLLVPSMKALYGTLDKHLNHFRRYSIGGAAQRRHRGRIRDRDLAVSQSAGGVRLVAQLASAEDGA